MAAEKLGAYILDHDEKSFIVNNSKLQEIEFSSGRATVSGEDKSELLDRDYNNYIDFKLSFDELNFKHEDAAVEKLEALAKDISKIEIKKNNKSVISNKQMRIDDNFYNLNRKQKRNEIENFIKDKYKDSKLIGTPKLKAWEITQDGWGNDVVKMQIKKNYARTQSMNDSIISIHTKSRDEVRGKENYKVKPHIHLTINRNNNWGRKYAYLKQELSQVMKKHNLTSSHNVDIKRDRGSKEYKEYRILKDRLSSFSWVVNKHEEGKYIIKQLKQYERNDKSVKLNNVEKKLNRYIELGGSYDFARKLQTNLKEKLNFEIDVKEPQEYKEASKNIDQGNYKQIINEVRSRALNGERISERYKEFAKEVLNKDGVDIKELAAARGIQIAVKNRGYQLDRNFNKIIDRQIINRFCDREIKTIERLEKKEKLNQLKEKVKAKEYLNQDKLRKDLKAAGIEDCKKTFGVSEVAVIFQGNEQYIRNNLKNDKFLAASEVKEEIEAMDIEITDSWKEKIADKIYKEQTPIAEKHQELKEIDIKLKNLKQQRKYTRSKVKSLSNNCKKIGIQLQNLTGGHSEDELLDEIDKSASRIKSGLKILLELYRLQNKASDFKKAKNIASKESKSELNNWNSYFEKQSANIEIIKKAAAENEVDIKNIKKLEKGYRVVLNDEQINFVIEDAQKAFKAYKIREDLSKHIDIINNKLQQFNETTVSSNIHSCKSKIAKLKRERGGVDQGGIFAKLTGKAKKAKNKIREINKRIVLEKEKLEKPNEKMKKIKSLKEKRRKVIGKSMSLFETLLEFKHKTKENKVKNINKKRERHRTR